MNNPDNRAVAVLIGASLLSGCVSPTSRSGTAVLLPSITVDQGSVAASRADQGWAFADEPDASAPTTSYRSHELLVAVDPSAALSDVLARVPGATLVDHLGSDRAMLRLRLPAATTPQAASHALLGVAGVRYASLNRLYTASYTFAAGTMDPYYPQQWAHRPEHANTAGAWDLLATLPDAPASEHRVIVAVVDTGLDVGHPEFAGRVEAPTNFTATNSLDPFTNTYPASTASNVIDTVGHGTHVAGIIGAAGGNAQGVAGVAWNVRLMPLKVFGDESADTFAILRALSFAENYVAPDGARVRVVNMSLGSAGLYHPEVAMDEAISELYDHGIVCAIAAGNESGPLTSPANTRRAIAVSSTSNSLGYEFLSGFSNYGPRIDVAAPGGAIWSTVPRLGSSITQQVGATATNAYGAISGTSMASPFVAGVAALIVARYASESVPANQTADFSARVIARLQQSADDLGDPGRDPYYGYGRVNARKAIEPPSL